MIEKFSDYEGATYLSEAGDFVFEVTDYELKDSAKGEPMAVFTVKSDKGQTTLYHSLNPKARWSYNSLIKACLKFDTVEKINAFKCDYETIGNQLVGTKFMGHVETDVWKKEVKVMNDDGTFSDGVEEKTTYKIKSYSII